eukprot:CAMPEP_0202972498 /NCGR_PEP_ID=MMETSP1396-20130829/37200_1 /ASSEMBLY_ACC=CAM_ASM_000872 /TAXON_ID= /ORGANISM="Pseudokeronopsis sp., Strain Brazil" /LENGTH=168 /DNA_ID=CAMNT_0049702983 /DNA_START=74 /DNA_END=580 /DNA_ORIENTATION=-
MSNYFNLEKSFGFYGAYHSESTNQWIHITCVPMIFATSIELLNRFAPFIVLQLLLAFYIVSFIVMETTAGVLYAPLLLSYFYIGTKVLPEYPMLSLSLWIFSWIAQFVGHGVFEKRAPALLKNLPQSLHAAVFFVWLEILFKLGYKPELQKKLEAAVAQERKKFTASD